MQMKKLRGNLMLLLTALIWGSAFVAQTVGMDHVGPFTFNCARMFLGALVLLPVIAWREEHNPANKKAHGLPENGSGRVLAAGGISCGVMLFLGSSLQQCGLQYTTPGKAGFITALYVVLVPIAGLAFGRKPRWWVWLSVAMSAAGLWLLCMTGAEGLSLGDSLVLLCALAFDQGIHLGAATPSVWMSILYLALFCTVAGYLLQNAALGVLSSRTVALLQCFCPVMTAMFSRLLLGEQLSTPGILGAVIILLCVAAETMMKDDKPLS